MHMILRGGRVGGRRALAQGLHRMETSKGTLNPFRRNRNEVYSRSALTIANCRAGAEDGGSRFADPPYALNVITSGSFDTNSAHRNQSGNNVARLKSSKSGSCLSSLASNSFHPISAIKRDS